MLYRIHDGDGWTSTYLETQDDDGGPQRIDGFVQKVEPDYTVEFAGGWAGIEPGTYQMVRVEE